jgi:hypothetical protein
VPDSPGTTGQPDDEGEEKGPDQTGNQTVEEAREEGHDERPGEPRHRKPSLDEVFGDVLPDTTGDEREASRPSGRHTRDDDILRDVPPHHGTR